MAGLFGGGQQAAPVVQQVPVEQPVLAQPAPMPVPDPEAQRRAALKADAIAAAGKTTRENTIIGSNDRLGG